MDSSQLYRQTSRQLSRLLTNKYSSSFSSASRLFSSEIRDDVYSVYGLVRIADEAVDTYQGADRRTLLDNLEKEVYAAIRRGFSTNPIVHAFADTARRYGISKELVAPFFASMRMDTQPQIFSEDMYQQYIYGSAEVVGLMCLMVFCGGNRKQYEELAPGARRLGAAYQKVNFLRDFADDTQRLGRCYFPGLSYDQFSESDKQRIIHDIAADFAAAKPYVRRLPLNARSAVETSYDYYAALLAKLQSTEAAEIKQRRVRISGWQKAWIIAPKVMSKLL